MPRVYTFIKTSKMVRAMDAIEFSLWLTAPIYDIETRRPCFEKDC